MNFYLNFIIKDEKHVVNLFWTLVLSTLLKEVFVDRKCNNMTEKNIHQGIYGTENTVFNI